MRRVQIGQRVMPLLAERRKTSTPTREKANSR